MHSWIDQDDNEQSVWKLIYTDEGSPASCLRFCFLPLHISTHRALPVPYVPFHTPPVSLFTSFPFPLFHHYYR